MTRLAAALALAGSFLAGAAAMAWWLTRTHDDRESSSCRGCGCTDYDGCLEGCYWVQDDLCSNCAVNLDPGGGWER